MPSHYKKTRTKKNIFCNFCKKDEKELSESDTSLVKGFNNTHICSFCANRVNAFLNGAQYSLGTFTNTFPDIKNTSPVEKDTKTPKNLLNYLNENVIGHDIVKKKISTVFYNHHQYSNDDDYLKNNVMIVGSSGTGKTLMAELLSLKLNLPFISVSASDYTSTGYHGKDVSSMIDDLYMTCQDIEKTEQGIIFIDEIDKISQKRSSEDVNGGDVQRALLKLIEGMDVYTDCIDKNGDTIIINTKNILFVCAGAFEGIDKIAEKRLGVNNGIGFNSNVGENNNINLCYDYEDLNKYGIINEFLGRMSILLQLKNLTKNEYVDIILKSNQSVFKYYQSIFSKNNSSLDITDEALNVIISKIKGKLGVRALKSIFYNILSDALFDLGNEDHKYSYTIDLKNNELVLI